jgi:hypothetical protein
LAGAISMGTVSAQAVGVTPPMAVNAVTATNALRSVRLLFNSILAVGSCAGGRSRFPGALSPPSVARTVRARAALRDRFSVR